MDLCMESFDEMRAQRDGLLNLVGNLIRHMNKHTTYTHAVVVVAAAVTITTNITAVIVVVVGGGVATAKQQTKK